MIVCMCDVVCVDLCVVACVACIGGVVVCVCMYLCVAVFAVELMCYKCQSVCVYVRVHVSLPLSSCLSLSVWCGVCRVVVAVVASCWCVVLCVVCVVLSLWFAVVLCVVVVVSL